VSVFTAIFYYNYKSIAPLFESLTTLHGSLQLIPSLLFPPSNSHTTKYNTDFHFAFLLFLFRTRFFTRTTRRRKRERKVANNMNNLLNDYNHSNIPHFGMGEWRNEWREEMEEKYQSARCEWDVHGDFVPTKKKEKRVEPKHKSVLQNQLLLLAGT
jgi:5'-3' exonuclease